ncbi:MAG: hypothetical protein K2Q10_08755 [Rhodospirillales bacterium]|nr:hypothetical protein [Rhodospirillales bacterium]
MKQEDFVYIAPDGARYEMIHHMTRPWWKSEEEYAPILHWHPTKVAWEFLRRSPEYFRRYYTWKWHRSDALMKEVGKNHPSWKLQDNLAQKVLEDFGIDPNWPPPSPNSSEFCPIFIDQISPQGKQIITTLGSLNKRPQRDLESLAGEIYPIASGGNWPRRQLGKPNRKAHRRQQLVIYLRLLDAQTSDASSDMIRNYISYYYKYSREDAQKRIQAHRRAAKDMAKSGYRKLAASP